MAEGFLRHYAGDRFEALSAGTDPASLHRLAVHVMSELGIDISKHRAKALDTLLLEAFEYVITVCHDADEACPVFPNALRRVHWSFPDPSRAESTPGDRLAVFRAVRDAIGARVEQFLAVAGHEQGRSP